MMIALGDIRRVTAVASAPVTGSGTVLVWVRWDIGADGSVDYSRSNVQDVSVRKEAADGTYTVEVPKMRDWGALAATIIESEPGTKVSLRAASDSTFVVHCYRTAIQGQVISYELANPLPGDQLNLSCWGEF